MRNYKESLDWKVAYALTLSVHSSLGHSNVLKSQFLKNSEQEVVKWSGDMESKGNLRYAK